MRITLLTAFTGLALLLGTPAPAAPPKVASDRPNILIVIADDCTFNELALYGGRNVQTPNLDRLAAQGLRFRRAYVGMSMCTPCRTELYTGLYPMSSGVCWNHAGAKPGTRSLPQYLGKLGYRVGIAGKVDVRPESVFPFEMVGGFERNCVARTADYECKEIGDFMARDGRQPFCLVIGLVVPHAPWTVGHPEHFNRAKFVLPPYLVDTPQTREALAHYYAEIEVMDQQLGDILKTLDQTGQAGRTLVLFTSEQGGQWPGCKWTNWEEGIRTALLVRWPGHVQPDRQTDALVQYADILPTLLEAAGGNSGATRLDGTSFMPVLQGQVQQHRKYIYAMHNNLPEGPPYPIRSISDGRFHYVRNLTPDALYIEKHVMGTRGENPYWLSWVWRTESDLHALAMVSRYLRRPPEQLYDTQTDPYEMKNLADDPQYAPIKIELRAELDRWMKQQGDPGAKLDTKQEQQQATPGAAP